MNIAILSPLKEAPSETFIHAHRTLIDGSIFYYYGGSIPAFYENTPLIQNYADFLLLKAKDKFSKFQAKEIALCRSFKKNKIDVVLAEFGTTGAHVYPVCKELNIPLIVHFHGFDASTKSVLEDYEDKYQKMFEYTEVIVVVSKAMKRKLIGLGAPVSKLVLNTYGPNNQFFDLNNSYNNKLFVAIGRFVDKKAPYFTLAAFKNVLDIHPDAKLIFGGDGPLLNVCKNLAMFWGLSDSVDFMGVVSPNLVKDLFSKAIAFVQHSMVAGDGDSEGTPVAVLEASAAGLPVISTRHGGIPDVILENISGVLVEEGDVVGMANAMIKLGNDFFLAQKMGQAGREHIRKNFTMTRHIKVLNEIFVNVKKNGNLVG